MAFEKLKILDLLGVDKMCVYIYIDEEDALKHKMCGLEAPAPNAAHGNVWH